ncbi:MAG: hypothetical protein RR313_00090 [Anaerovoracaceae bacterium]
MSQTIEAAKKQVNLLVMELEDKHLPQERLQAIKAQTEQLAEQVDKTMQLEGFLVKLVEQHYSPRRTYPRRQITRVVDLLVRTIE